MPDLLWLADDPGVPLGRSADPFAGLPDAAARALRECLELVEGKAIGTADMMSGDMRQRDARLRYHWPSSVQHHIRLASTNASRKLETVADTASLEVGTVMTAWLDGKLPYTEAQEQTAFAWRKAYERAREIGRQASGLDRLHPEPKILAEEETWFRSAVREELRYWHLFLEEVKAGSVTEARMQARFFAYVDALRFMYEGARVYAMPDNVLLYWMGPKPVAEDPKQVGHICGGCTYMMERSPFPKLKLPAVPRDGSTACLVNCRHKIVVRVGKDADVFARFQALPSRASMVTALRKIKEEAHGTARQQRARAHARRTRERGRKHVHNPFHREPLTEDAEHREHPVWARVREELWPHPAEDEDAAEPHDGTVKGKRAVIGAPFFFRREPHAANTVAKTDPSGYHGQHDPPGSSLKLGEHTRKDVVVHLAYQMITQSRRWPAGAELSSQPYYVRLTGDDLHKAFMETVGDPSYGWVGAELDRVDAVGERAWQMLERDVIALYRRDIEAYSPR